MTRQAVATGATTAVVLVSLLGASAGHADEPGIPEVLSIGASYTASVPADPAWPDIGGTSLTDGEHGEALFGPAWQGRDAVGSYQIDVDLGETADISEVASFWLQDGASFVFLPPSIDLYVSVDGEDYLPAGSIPAPDLGTQTQVVTYRLSELDVEARHVRLVVDGGTAWTMISEIEISGLRAAPPEEGSACDRTPSFSATFIQPDLIDGWSDSELDEAVDVLHEACIDAQILQWTADSQSGTTVVPIDLDGFDHSSDTDVLGRLLTAQEDAGGEVVVGLQLNHDFFEVSASDPGWLAAEAELAGELAAELYAAYGDSPAFGGWYLPFEVDNLNFPGQLEWDRMVTFYDEIVTGLRQLDPDLPISIAPFYNDGLAGSLDPAGWQEMWTHILAGVEIDILALQDGVGAGHVTLDRLPAWFAATRNAIDAASADTELYADTETFIFGASGLQPMPMNTFLQAMAIVEPYVTGHWAFAYDHYQSPVSTGSNAWHSTYLRYLADGTIGGEAPTVPQALAATPVSARTIELTWSGSSHDLGVAGYEVHRDGAHVATILGDATEFTDALVEPGAQYVYGIRAFDAAGNLSALSTPATATTPAATVYPSLWSAGASYDSTVPASEAYPDTGGTSLTDGVLGGLGYGPAWQGRNAPGTYEFTIDLGESRPIGSIGSRWLQVRSDYVFLPPSVVVSTSVDGADFVQQGVLRLPAVDAQDQIKTYVLDDIGVHARYVRLAVDGGTAWTMIDEVEVRGPGM